MIQEILSLSTPSKINIFLKIKSKLPNGYHEIETIFLPLYDISDKISMNFSCNTGITITSDNNCLSLDEGNLCYKAAEAYAKESMIVPSWKINIEKNIPIAAGMGGGSSDAATVLILLQKFYKNILSNKQLYSIALKLGADVPYFLKPTPALGRGIGEKLEPVSVAPGLYFVVLAPQFPVSSTWAYNHYKPASSHCAVHTIDDVIKCLNFGDWARLGCLLYNDLAAALYKKFPALKIFKEDLIEAGAINAEITGSGPALYAIVNDKQKAAKIVTNINDKYNDAVLCLCSGINNR